MIAFLLLLLIAAPAFAVDPLDHLIDQEKEAREEWTADAETLPLAYLWGDLGGVEIYAPHANEDKTNFLCEAISFDELIELSRGSPQSQETVLNVDIPRVREVLQKTCLIRPKDTLFVIGENWQKRVRVKDYVVKKQPTPCPNDSPYALWMTLEEPLTEPPVFFTTKVDWEEGENRFSNLVENKFSNEDDIRNKLSKKIPDFYDYNVTYHRFQAPNVSTIYVLRRKIITLEDDTLPNEMLLWDNGKDVDQLWVERVDQKKGSGRVRVSASFDFNADGLLDLIITGDHTKCVYTQIFEGKIDGFSPIDLPLKPCRCP